jgi:hypothetical protein
MAVTCELRRSALALDFVLSIEGALLCSELAGNDERCTPVSHWSSTLCSPDRGTRCGRISASRPVHRRLLGIG